MNRTYTDSTSLSHAEVGTSYKVVKIQGGEKFRSKMISMGIIPDKIVQITNCDGCSGPLALKVGFSKVIIGRGMAEKISVKPL